MNKSVELEREEGDETSSNVELPCGLRDLPTPRPPPPAPLLPHRSVEAVQPGLWQTDTNCQPHTNQP